MAPSNPYVPTARNIASPPSIISTAPNDRLPTAPKAVHLAANKHRKAQSAPPVLVNGRKYARYDPNSIRTTKVHTAYANPIVKSKSVTSRSASPSSSLSATETLAHFSDSSSVTATEAASPKLCGASVAARRCRFKAEFGTENAIATSSNDPIKQVKHAEYAEEIHEEEFVTMLPMPERTTVRAATQKTMETQSSKKVSRSCGPKLDFAYRNVYTTATGIGSVGSAPAFVGKRKVGRDGFEAPNVASAHVGCVVM